MKRIFLFAAVVFLGTKAISQPMSGLLGYFKLDGNTTNSGPGSITATAIGTSYTTNNSNTANKAIQFDGTLNSYIDFVDNGNLDFTGTNNFTISFSFYFNGNSTSGLIDNCLNYAGWGVWFWQATPGIWNLQFNYKGNSIGSSAATAFTLNAWHHVAAVRNNGTLSIYIDGTLRLSGPEGSTSPSYPINMVAGAMAYGGFSPPRYNPVNGKIDEILIYNRALSAPEISALTLFALPLKLTGFNARIVNHNGILDWETTDEQNTKSFDIERSIDGRNYTAVGNVAAFNMAGDHQYSFTDNNITLLGAAVVYYRLNQKDLDGKFTYSRIIALSIDNNKNIVLLYPNPVLNEANITITISRSESIQAKVIDNAGRIVKQQQLNVSGGSTSLSLDVSTLAKGMYYLELKGETVNERKQFIKQ